MLFKSMQSLHNVKVGSLSSKVRIKKAYYLDYQNIFQKMLCRQSCYEIYKSHRQICLLKIARIYLSIGVLKTDFYYFFKYFPGQTKETNENAESISRPLYKIQSQQGNFLVITHFLLKLSSLYFLSKRLLFHNWYSSSVEHIVFTLKV